MKYMHKKKNVYEKRCLTAQLKTMILQRNQRIVSKEHFGACSHC